MKQKKRVSMTTAFYVAALSLPFFSEMALANMSVYPMELNVDKSGAAQIKVASKTDDIQFIRVRQKKILNPGTAQEKEIDVASWKEGGVVVTPEKFALAAGAMRVVRLVSLTPPEKETTWLHQGLVSQAFSLSFTLADNMEVSGATFTNGLLHIDLTRNEPEQIAPQRIAISERPALNS